MKTRTWIIIGATSIIAEQFAHLAAKSGFSLRLVGRDQNQLDLLVNDIKLRYSVCCDFLTLDMRSPATQLVSVFANLPGEYDLFIAHSDLTENNQLSTDSIADLIAVNILSTTQLIHAYLTNQQSQHHLIYLSSVAACRGRAKNSLYGASKAAIEVYLEGLQQAATPNQHITIARLGFIDTKQTYGVPGVFYAAKPADCAKACWQALQKNKRRIYYPAFWGAIMAVIMRLPFFIYKRARF